MNRPVKIECLATSIFSAKKAQRERHCGGDASRKPGKSSRRITQLGRCPIHISPADRWPSLKAIANRSQCWRFHPKNEGVADGRLR
jgi:hypothetical protein